MYYYFNQYTGAPINKCLVGLIVTLEIKGLPHVHGPRSISVVITPVLGYQEIAIPLNQLILSTQESRNSQGESSSNNSSQPSLSLSPLAFNEDRLLEVFILFSCVAL